MAENGYARAQDAEQEGSASRTLVGMTKPSKVYELAFANPGRVVEVAVKEGDRVEQDQLLMRQDTRADEAALRRLQLEADVDARIELAENQRDQAQVELRRMEERPLGFGASERERAALELKAGETRIIEERRQGLVAEAKAEEQKVIIDEKTMSSPDSGVVQKIEAATGEVFLPQNPALRLVKIDPLYVEVPETPAYEAMRLKVGDTLQVRYSDSEEWRQAKVVFIDPEGNPNTEQELLLVRLELPNPEGRVAGLRMQVRLPSGQAAPTAAR